MKKIIFVCIHNSGRSQMAEAFANKLGAGRIVAESAGTTPGDALNPAMVQAMSEIGYDMGGHHPKPMTLEMVDSADRMITMGCGVDTEGVCPASFIPTEDWGLDDTKDQPIEKVRAIRDEIKARVARLIEEITVGEG